MRRRVGDARKSSRRCGRRRESAPSCFASSSSYLNAGRTSNLPGRRSAGLCARAAPELLRLRLLGTLPAPQFPARLDEVLNLRLRARLAFLAQASGRPDTPRRSAITPARSAAAGATCAVPPPHPSTDRAVRSSASAKQRRRGAERFRKFANFWRHVVVCLNRRSHS